MRKKSNFHFARLFSYVSSWWWTCLCPPCSSSTVAKRIGACKGRNQAHWQSTTSHLMRLWLTPWFNRNFRMEADLIRGSLLPVIATSLRTSGKNLPGSLFWCLPTRMHWSHCSIPATLGRAGTSPGAAFRGRDARWHQEQPCDFFWSYKKK